MEALTAKINAAARELAEAIDGSLAKDLEKEYAGGEAHVYVHRLFLARGGRLQRSVAERYGKERLVRGRVDSYVRLFERLLDIASGLKSGDSVVDACLASEAGQIYLMLAQAAGRLAPAK
ncbi:MAG: hypothetical protein ACKVP5_04410 [Aestuariivirga sp.]